MKSLHQRVRMAPAASVWRSRLALRCVIVCGCLSVLALTVVEQSTAEVCCQKVKSFGMPEQAGSRPTTPVILGTDGFFYGTTAGRAPDLANVYRVGTDGSNYQVLHRFEANGGEMFPGRVIEAADGRLYGTTSYGGSNNLGRVFRLNKDGSGYQELHQFTSAGFDGQVPAAGLTEGANGMLYGVTAQGGSNNAGTVYRLARDGSNYQLLHTFTHDYQDGEQPRAVLVKGPGNTLYGTTSVGSSNNMGTVFKLNEDGSGDQTLYVFGSSISDARSPSAELLLGSDGYFYGTSPNGGSYGFGTAYRIKPDGTSYSVLYQFDSVTYGVPGAAVAEGTDGALYGTTTEGCNCAGTVFKLNKNGTGYTTLHSFMASTDGQMPEATLWIGTNGVLVGTTEYGGTYNTAGTLFTLNQNGSGYQILRYFYGTDGGDGRQPYAGLVEGSDGRLYGTTWEGGTYTLGTVYGVNKDGSGYQILHHFSNSGGDGQKPWAGLSEGTGGVLFGTTYYGGVTNCGTVFRVNHDGSGYAILHSFGSGTDGTYPRGQLIEGPDAFLYGTACLGGSNNLGIVFQLDHNGGSYAVLHTFSPRPELNYPLAGLCLASNGLFYGSTAYGGSSNSGGIFQMNPDGSGYLTLVSITNGVTERLSGGGPEGRLRECADGRLYGTTYRGGTTNLGTVFRVEKDGTGFQVLHSFGVTPDDGQLPDGDLVEGADGALYSTTAFGGTNNTGVAFMLNKDGSSYTVLKTFGGGTDPLGPRGGLVRGNDNLFYGASAGGGDHGNGAVFKLWPPQTPVLRIAGGSENVVSIWGTPAAQYQLVESTNLIDWLTTSSFVMPQAGVWTYTIAPAAQPRMFYRAKWNP